MPMNWWIRMTDSHAIMSLRLGVNIDHVATIRNARGGRHPEPIRAARLAVDAGADGITAHLREDRRHISDNDISQLMAELECPLNLEMAATDEMLNIALDHVPNACCLVPEKRQELTTEGGLDVFGQRDQLAPVVGKLQDKGIRVSLFIDPDFDQISTAMKSGLILSKYIQALMRRHHLMVMMMPLRSNSNASQWGQNLPQSWVLKFMPGMG